MGNLCGQWGGTLSDPKLLGKPVDLRAHLLVGGLQQELPVIEREDVRANRLNIAVGSSLGTLDSVQESAANTLCLSLDALLSPFQGGEPTSRAEARR